MRYAQDKNILKTRSKVKITVTRKMVCETPPSQDASTHQIWDSYLKEYRKYAPDTKRDRRTKFLRGLKFGTTVIPTFILQLTGLAPKLVQPVTHSKCVFVAGISLILAQITVKSAIKTYSIEI